MVIELPKYKLEVPGIQHWNLYLNDSQLPIIGWIDAFSKRETAVNFLDISDHELLEIKVIAHTMVDALSRHTPIVRPNVLFKGNLVKKLHAHVFPRYKGSVEVYGHAVMDNPDTEPLRNTEFLVPAKMEELKSRYEKDLSASVSTYLKSYM